MTKLTQQSQLDIDETVKSAKGSGDGIKMKTGTPTRSAMPLGVGYALPLHRRKPWPSEALMEGWCASVATQRPNG